MARYAANPLRRSTPDWSAPELAYTAAIAARAQLPLHRSLPGYEPTPLRDCPDLARELGLGAVRVKDEAGRFGNDAFKGLGASYAIFQVISARWRQATGQALSPEAFRDPTVRERLGEITFAAATDGNHGRAVAWVARLIGQRAVIFMPADAARARVAAVRREGATVELIAGTFDDCVAACATTAAERNWQVIADTAYPGNLEIPGFIMTGYSTIFAEIADQAAAAAAGARVAAAPTEAAFDAVFLPAGVGGLAAAGAVSFVQQNAGARPRLVCVEPEESACFLESILRGGGEPVAARGNQQSIMVGLCCAVPSLLAWPVLRDAVDLFLAIEDEHALAAMRLYHRHGITAGESGASTLAGLLALLDRRDLAPARAQLRLDAQSRVLLINTEGATDPEHYARVIAGGNPGVSP
ncbi:MAG: diaminopropionate ammonia-lyase [Candidatus Krumholzibacteria bacterium]|jgi:diaminopropionate ammonia-lyase|nr:diaminopropionate ammonia-lyase [Candidatus Krumholzibacteria bacterium]